MLAGDVGPISITNNTLMTCLWDGLHQSRTNVDKMVLGAHSKYITEFGVGLKGLQAKYKTINKKWSGPP